MRLTAKKIIDDVFSSLLSQIDQGRIVPGSQEERDYLKFSAESSLRTFLEIHGIGPATVTVGWNQSRPDDLLIEIDPFTRNILKSRGLYD